MISQEKLIVALEKNWAEYEKLLSPFSTDRYQKMLTLLKEEKSRLIVCPSSTRTDYHGAFPGGLVLHSLKVLETMTKLNDVYRTDISVKSLIVSALLHDIGKIGNEKHDYYLEKDSDWHRKQGIMYEVNPKLTSGVPTSVRSLCLLNRYGIELTEDEFLAIASIKDRQDQINDSIPTNGESMLAVILQQAVKVSCLQLRGKTSIIDLK